MLKLKPINLKPILNRIGSGVVKELTDKVFKQVQFGGKKYAKLKPSTIKRKTNHKNERLIDTENFSRQGFSQQSLQDKNLTGIRIFINDKKHYSGLTNSELATFHLKGRDDMASTTMFPQNDKHIGEIKRWKSADKEITAFYQDELKKSLKNVIKTIRI